MVSEKSVHKQLKKLGFNYHGWGRGEVSELPNIILPDEEIFELVNGIYEGGFALLVATDVRVLLVDKKPLNYLTVEDLRFDMINEMDYSHRLLGAQISIATGNKTLRFRSYNQPRLRKLIGHVQHSMAEIKKKQSNHQEGQNKHLEQMNQQLQAYLVAQHQHQLELQKFQEAQQAGITPPPPPEPVKPSPELSDYLLAQSLLAQHQAETGQAVNIPPQLPAQIQLPPAVSVAPPIVQPPTDDLVAEGRQEVFGKQLNQPPAPTPEAQTATHHPLEINPMRIAYSKLPMALRNRKFGRPSFHAHSESTPPAAPPVPADAQPITP
jgi:hypothetical protein